ncbi:hypothetical protein ACWDAZ_30400, partial [Streptomyces sp. NPDC001215]
ARPVPVRRHPDVRPARRRRARTTVRHRRQRVRAVSAKLDTAALLDLDSQVQLDNKDPLDVAKAWLKSAGLD